MASISRTQPNCDRISNLPDNLITHILSFLSTEDAVKTSILSTSWNQQWTLVPVLRFVKGLQWPEFYSLSFINFVYRVLRYNNVTTLDLFQLPLALYHAIHISNWISTIVSRHVRQIDISARVLTNGCLPDCLYSSKTLVVLKLKGNFVFRLPEIISLVSLKIIHYEADYYRDDDDSEESGSDFFEVGDDYEVSDISELGGNSEVGESISRLVSSCPVLEELQIRGQLEETVKVLNISSLVLKRLIIKDLYQDDDSHRLHVYKLVLNTPNLQYLELNDKYGVPDNYRLNTLHSLDTALLDLNLYYAAGSWEELLLAISNVRALYFSKYSIENLFNTVVPDLELPKFDRLSYLEVGGIESNIGLRFLMAFLQSSRQLEYLSFYLVSWDGTWDDEDSWDETWYAPTHVPFCMIYNLKVIKVYYVDDEEEPLLNVLTYFLKKTNYLEELIILHPKKKNEKFIKKVSMLPRASNACRIVLM